MKVELIIPIDSLRGKLRQDGFYFRKYRGQQIVQKCPDRSKHVKTENEAANQRRFAAKYAGKRKRGMTSRITDDVNRHDMPENKQNINPPDRVWVGATLPAAPSVRSAKSRHFSMALTDKAYGKGNHDVRDCVHIRALGKLLFPHDEEIGQGVYTHVAE